MSEEEKKAIEKFKRKIERADKDILNFSDVYTTLDIHNLRLLLNLIEKQQKEIKKLEEQKRGLLVETYKNNDKKDKEIEKEKLYTDFYKDLCDKQQEELENNKKFKKDIVDLIMLWDKKELPENNMIIETLETIMNEFSRLENIEDEKIQVAVKFIEEKRDKFWKDKIGKLLEEYKDTGYYELEKVLEELLRSNL